MDKISKLAFLVLLACSYNASASFMYNTDTANDDSRKLTPHQRVTDRYSIDVDTFFAEMERSKLISREHSDGVKKRKEDAREHSGDIKKEKDHSRSLEWMDDDDFFTKKHPRRDRPHFEQKWHESEGHHPKIDFKHHRDHIPAVPLPAAVWLFGSGLIGLIAFARKKA